MSFNLSAAHNYFLEHNHTEKVYAADDLRLVRPSSSAPLNEVDLARVKFIMQKIEAFVEPNEEAGFTKPGGIWDRNVAHSHYEYSRLLAFCNPTALRYFRFLCITFSGWSVYHNDHSRHVDLPNILNFTEQDADEHWKNATFPDQFYRSHLDFAEGLAPGLIFQPPLWLGEAGWIKDGTFISFDQRHIQERLYLLYASGLIEWMEKKIRERGEIRILEIGGGYGALALALKNYFPQASYTIIDIADSLRFSGTYLTLTRPDFPISIGLDQARYGLRLVPITLAEELSEEFDLVINTLSMSEMLEIHVDNYCRLMTEKWIPQNGYFYEQNGTNAKDGGNDPELIIERRLVRQKGYEPANLHKHIHAGKSNVWHSPGANKEMPLKPLTSG